MLKTLKELFRGQEAYLREARQRLPLHEAGLDGVRKVRRPLTDNHVVLDDPYDLAAVDKFIWHVVKQKLEAMAPEETLVILAGECHVMPMTIMPQAGLLTNLAKWRDEAPDDPARQIMFAYEQPYDLLYYMATDGYKKNLPDEARQLLHHHDENGHIAAKVTIGHDDIPHAAHTVEQVMRTAIRNNISFCFNDASFDRRYYLLPDDAIARRVANDEYGIDLSKKKVSRMIHPHSLAIRNGVMAERAIEQAREKGVRIIVQRAGQAHLYGEPQDKSLTARFNKVAGCKVLGISFRLDHANVSSMTRLFPPLVRDNPDHIIFENIGADHFHHRQKEQEKEFAARLYQAYGNEECPYAQDDLPVSTADGLGLIDDVLEKAGVVELPPPQRWWKRFVPKV